MLGVEDDHAAVKNLENSLVWLSRACPIKELTMMLSFSISRKRTDSQKVLFSEVCKALERRWVEIKGKLGEVLARNFFPFHIATSNFLNLALISEANVMFRGFSTSGAGTFRQFLGSSQQSPF